ncbi:MAG: hypothetical protein J6Y92_03660 [Lentisphaeria bacterium]|nr:hypothetical protein [Lentisphaeria bacterium]
MNLIDKSYLHPVLRPGYDDVEGVFDFVCSDGNIRPEANKYVIDIHATFKNETIESLIKDGKAKIFVFVCCTANFYRKAKEIASFDETIEIPTEELSGHVDLTLIVSATQQLHYQNTSQHSDYGNAAFDIECGDILAVSDTYSFIAEKEYDSLQKIDSFISIVADDDMKQNEPLTVINWHSDKIQVKISRVVYDKYMILQKAKKNTPTTTLENVIFLPILVSIISEWQDYEEEYGLYKWFGAIKAKADSLDLANDIRERKQSPFALAQRLLDAPITRCVDEVMNKWNRPGEGEEE